MPICLKMKRSCLNWCCNKDIAMKKTGKHTTEQKRIGIFSSCNEDWGGSEELWGRSIPILHEKGIKVAVSKERLNFAHPKMKQLAEKGVTLPELSPAVSIQKARIRRIKTFIKRQIKNKEKVYYKNNPAINRFRKEMKVLK